VFHAVRGTFGGDEVTKTGMTRTRVRRLSSVRIADTAEAVVHGSVASLPL